MHINEGTKSDISAQVSEPGVCLPPEDNDAVVHVRVCLQAVHDSWVMHDVENSGGDENDWVNSEGCE